VAVSDAPPSESGSEPWAVYTLVQTTIQRVVIFTRRDRDE
jgi:hypothetical protein